MSRYKMNSTEEYIETPHTKQLILKKDRWSNATFVREYYRMRRRKEGTVPYINEDGSFKRQTVDYYTKKTKKRCELCNTEVFESNWRFHVKSKGHLRLEKITSVDTVTVQ